MGSDVGQIFPTASLHRDHSISYALVCEKEISYPRVKSHISLSSVQEKEKHLTAVVAIFENFSGVLYDNRIKLLYSYVHVALTPDNSSALQKNN